VDAAEGVTGTRKRSSGAFSPRAPKHTCEGRGGGVSTVDSLGNFHESKWLVVGVRGMLGNAPCCKGRVQGWVAALLGERDLG
jgi:hypothetical protein